MPSFQPVRVLGYHEDGRQRDLGGFAGVTLTGDAVAVWPGNHDLLRRDSSGTWRHVDAQGWPQKFTKVELTTFNG